MSYLTVECLLTCFLFCFEQPPRVSKTNTAVSRHSGVINRIVRLVRSVDQQPIPTSTSGNPAEFTDPPVTMDADYSGAY